MCFSLIINLITVSDDSLSGGSVPVPVPPCGHPQCARAAARGLGATLLPYTWLQAAAVNASVHNTEHCRCAACRSLSQPPPSYTNLFLDDQPPEYNDSLVIKQHSPDNTETSADVCQELPSCSVNESSHDVVIDITEDQEVIINVEDLKNMADEETPLTETKS